MWIQSWNPRLLFAFPDVPFHGHWSWASGSGQSPAACQRRFRGCDVLLQPLAYLLMRIAVRVALRAISRDYISGAFATSFCLLRVETIFPSALSQRDGPNLSPSRRRAPPIVVDHGLHYRGSPGQRPRGLDGSVRRLFDKLLHLW